MRRARLLDGVDAKRVVITLNIARELINDNLKRTLTIAAVGTRDADNKEARQIVVNRRNIQRILNKAL